MQLLRERPLADHQEARGRDPLEHPRPCLEERRVALLGFQTCHHPDERSAFGEAVLLGKGATRLGVVVAGEVHPVVDELDGCEVRTALSSQFPHHGLADSHQPVHRRGETHQGLAVREATHPR
jgi:hypothetical protein